MANVNNYIKLPNQGNINSNIRLLYEMSISNDYADAHGYFTKADVAEIAANALLITTGNVVGGGVVNTIRSANVDEGDNSPLQNAKMRMQILRILGLVSADYDSGIYAINPLGELVVSDKITSEQRRNLIRELFMCIESSSEAYDFTCPEGFHCFLGLEICYAFACLDYKIAVSEMPIITTYDYREIDEFILKVKDYRSRGVTFPSSDSHFPKTNKGMPLAQASNITRTINQILRYCSIIAPKPKKIEGTNFYVCSEEGRAYVDKIKRLWEMGRITFMTSYTFRKLRILSQKENCKQGLDSMYARAGMLSSDTKHEDGFFFSPYQTLPETTVSWLLGKKVRQHPERKDSKVQAINSSLTTRDLRLKAVYEANVRNRVVELAAEEQIVNDILNCVTDSGKRDYALKQEENHKNDDKFVFYPYVHSLLRILGLDCKGEVGRYDAFAMYGKHIIPVEVKSPTEDVSYNQKGVRQAIENKVCSYNGDLSDDMEYAAIVVGYNHPTNDSDIKELISAAYEQLGIKIIAIDLKSLLNMCMRVICDNMRLDMDQLLRGYGIINEETL